MKMLIAAFVIFPAGWVAMPRTPPVPVGNPPLQLSQTQCAEITVPGAGQVWKSARLVTGLRDVAALDRLGEGPVVVVDAQLRGQRLAGHRAANICFEGGDLAKTDWRGARADRVAFATSDLSGATMTGARLRDARFSIARLDGMDATRADLSGAEIEGGSFSGLVLRRSKLHGFRLVCVLISSIRNCEGPDRPVDARDADLSGATMDVYNLDEWRLDGAVLDGTTVQFNQIRSFGAAKARGPVILESSGFGQRLQVRLTVGEWRQLLASFWGRRPSFDCARARTSVEKAICGRSGRVAEVDRRLDRLYRTVLAAGRTTRAQQRRWLAVRNACGSEEATMREGCLIGTYADRFAALMQRGAAAHGLVPGERRLFLSGDVAPPPAFQRTALYVRIFPVLLATASSTVRVRAVDRRQIEASGDAWGSNAHMCDISGRRFSFDPRSGWFGAMRSADYREFYPDEPRFEGVLQIAGSEAVVGPPGETWNSGEYVLCGARASFDAVTAVRVPAPHRGAVWYGGPG